MISVCLCDEQEEPAAPVDSSGRQLGGPYRRHIRRIFVVCWEQLLLCIRRNYDKRGGKHAPMWCLWVKWTAGQAVIANDSSQVHRGHVCEWFSYLFPQQANPLQESRIRHLWERLVFISRRHLPRHTFCWGKNGKDSEDGEVFSKVVTEKISHHSQHFLLPQRPSFWFLSLFIHSIFNLSHKAHYSYVPAAIAVRLSELLAIHSTPLQYP